ncbi:hypothetical protein [Streptomyces sp. NPDC059943]|uniref:hypothetical protein n=1 Tax=Streptomyces sp. NPDC059943 TaxID=3347010 RepID=UPI0036470B68
MEVPGVPVGRGGDEEERHVDHHGRGRSVLPAFAGWSVVDEIAGGQQRLPHRGRRPPFRARRSRPLENGFTVVVAVVVQGDLVVEQGCIAGRRDDYLRRVESLQGVPKSAA